MQKYIGTAVMVGGIYEYMQHCCLKKSATNQGPNLQNLVKWTFVILSQFFHMSANKLSYEKFTKELRKNYEKTYDGLQSYERVLSSLRKV